MANVATVSFKLSPEGYAVLKAMAAGEGRSVSEFVRTTVTEALELNTCYVANLTVLPQLASGALALTATTKRQAPTWGRGSS